MTRLALALLVFALVVAHGASSRPRPGKPPACSGGFTTRDTQAVCFTGCTSGPASQLWEIFRTGFTADVQAVVDTFGCTSWRRV